MQVREVRLCRWAWPNKKGLQVIVIACKPYILKLEAASGFEPEIAILQTAALPLGYAAPKKMERETGFEPATSTLARSHSTTELFPLNS